MPRGQRGLVMCLCSRTSTRCPHGKAQSRHPGGCDSLAASHSAARITCGQEESRHSGHQSTSADRARAEPAPCCPVPGGTAAAPCPGAARMWGRECPTVSPALSFPPLPAGPAGHAHCRGHRTVPVRGGCRRVPPGVLQRCWGPAGSGAGCSARGLTLTLLGFISPQRRRFPPPEEAVPGSRSPRCYRSSYVRPK